MYLLCGFLRNFMVKKYFLSILFSVSSALWDKLIAGDGVDFDFFGFFVVGGGGFFILFIYFLLRKVLLL